jgi:hypothetical protein
MRSKWDLNEEFIHKIICDYNPELYNKTPYICYNKDLAEFEYTCIYNDEGDKIDINDLREETTKK